MKFIYPFCILRVAELSFTHPYAHNLLGQQHFSELIDLHIFIPTV